jgi:hypothetical protein
MAKGSSKDSSSTARPVARGSADAMKIVQKPVDTLIPYINNSRTHSDSQVAQIAASIKEFGWTNPILVDGENGIIAGHGRLMAARKLGYTEVPTIELKDLTETQRKAYIIADNKLALNADWDNEILALELAELGDMGFDLDVTGFAADEIAELLSPDDDEDDSKYSKKIDAPVYEPTGDCPPILELYDKTKYEELTAKIYQEDSIDSEIKDFLLAAAARHIRFDFEQIAEFYAHAPPDIQQLMEDSALVIVDFEKAIAGGYVKLSQVIGNIYTSEKGTEQ